MNIRHNLMRYVMAMIGMVMMAACSDDDNWQAGPGVKEGCQQVHFLASNATLAMLSTSDTDNRTVNLTVARNTNEGQLTVPITGKTDSEKLILPAEVTFEDGQDEATVIVKVTGDVEDGTSHKYTLQLTGDEVDPYAVQDGSSLFEGMISFPKQRMVQMWLSNGTNMIDAAGYWNESILDMGSGIYKFENLMESGMELTITLDANNRMSLSCPWWSEENGNMYPNYYEPTDCYYWCNSWDYDNEQWVYWPFYPHGKDAYLWIEQMEFYTDSNTSGWYSYYWKNTADPTQSYFCLTLASLKLNTDRTNNWWQELRFRIIGDDEEIPEEYLPEAPETPEDPEPGQLEPLYEPGDYQVEMWFEGTEGTIGRKWTETMTVSSNGTYSFADLMNSGMDLSITLDANYRMTLTSSWLSEEENNVVPNYWYSTDCYYYCNRWSDEAGEYVYWPFYPYGMNTSIYVEYITMYTDANPQNWYSYYWEDTDNAEDSYFSITLGYLKLSNETNYREWAELRFKVKNQQ